MRGQTGRLDRAASALTWGTAGFAVASLVRPEWLSGEVASAGQSYFARMYAARALPLAAGLLLTRGERRRPLLWIAATAQVADSILGVTGRDVRQAIPTALGAVLYASAARRAERCGQDDHATNSTGLPSGSSTTAS